jgi:hypothetical protein
MDSNTAATYTLALLLAMYNQADNVKEMMSSQDSESHRPTKLYGQTVQCNSDIKLLVLLFRQLIGS